MLWSDLAAIFFLGLTGTGHCIGMCGAFSMTVSVGAERPSVVLWRQVSYQLGKATAYVFIGLVLLLAVGWADAQWPLLRLQTVVGVAVGAVMIAMGAAYVFELRLPAGIARWWQGKAACAALAGLWRSPSLLKSVLIGWINGFLPCGLSLMALLALASQGSTSGLVAGAYVFGLGTMPGLLAVGLLGQRLSTGSRRWLVRVGGAALIVFGVLTVVRGRPAVHDWAHEHFMPGGHGAAHTGHPAGH